MRLQSKWFAVGIATIFLVTGLEAYVVAFTLYEHQTIRVACVGDSITRDTTDPDKLETLLGANYDVINFGVDRTTVSFDFEKPYYNQMAAKFAHWFNPDIVIIMLGTNDAYLSLQQRSNFIADYTKLVTSFQTLSSKPICIPPPAFNNIIELNPTTVENMILPRLNRPLTALV